MKKFTIVLLFFALIIWTFIHITYAAKDESTPYSTNQWFDLYKERVKNICEEYKTKKELINIEDKYTEIDWNYSLDSVVKDYKTDMNNIYKCALITIQKKSLLLIKDDLAKKNPIILEKVWQKIDSQISKLDATNSSLWCKNNDDKSSIVKLNVLQQSTYETCKYVNYLQYLNEYTDNIPWWLGSVKEEYSTSEIILLNNQRKNQIQYEIDHAYKVFPMVFHALTEYENNITIHFLLELIKDDYVLFREKLHEVLNPINQVVYKISNAMRK